MSVLSGSAVVIVIGENAGLAGRRLPEKRCSSNPRARQHRYAENWSHSKPAGRQYPSCLNKLLRTAKETVP